jgi:hypothetical protein
MHAAHSASLALGLACFTALTACGSGGADEYSGNKAGKPASATPTKTDAGATASPSTAGGSGGATDGDGGSTSFGSQTVSSFTLIDAKITTEPEGSPIPGFDPIAYGATIDLGVVGVYLSLRADLPSSITKVGSVAFALDATFTHTSEGAPYSVCGDDGKGNFILCVLPVGKHTLTATIYPEADLGGQPYQPPTIFEFNVIDSELDGGADADADPE